MMNCVTLKIVVIMLKNSALSNEQNEYILKCIYLWLIQL